MKLLLTALLAFGCVSANATKIIRAGEARPQAIGDSYQIPTLVGRLSVFTWQAELTGMLVVDPANPTRKVKATLDISMDAGAGEIDDTQAWERAGFFYDAKRGFGYDGGGGKRAVGKLVAVIYDPADVVYDTTNCMGADLQVADLPLTLLTKSCYRVRPKYIIETPAL